MTRGSRPRSGRMRRRPAGASRALGSAASPLIHPAVAARQVLTARLQETCREAANRALSPEPTVRALSLLMDEAYRAYDEALEGVDFDPPMACERGCFHCCYNQVGTSQPEALVLGLALLERNDPAWLEALAGRAASTVEAIQGLTREGIGAIRHELPCIFLEDGACSIHPFRPLVCRGWNSVDAGQCRASIENRSPLDPIENHPLPRELAEAVQTGLLEGVSALGLEAGYLVLARAVRLMLRRGVVDCAGQWLGGRGFFQSRDW